MAMMMSARATVIPVVAHGAGAEDAEDV